MIVAVSNRCSGGDAVVGFLAKKVRKAISFEGVPKYLGQPARQPIQLIEIKSSVFNKQRSPNFLIGLQYLVANGVL